jgi:hypothetical protein
MPGDDNINELPRSPDDPASPAETAQAESFARLIDQLMVDDSLPPAMASDERALVEVAAIMRACVRDADQVELSASRTQALIDKALLQALEHGSDQGSSHQTDDNGEDGDEGAAWAGGVLQDGSVDVPARSPGKPHQQAGDVPAGDVIDLGARRRRRLGTILPWAITAAAAAAALFLALQRPAPERTASLPEPEALSEVHRSRPADALIGQIPRDRAERASDRLDMIYADRMAGYRDLRLRGGHR